MSEPIQPIQPIQPTLPADLSKETREAAQAWAKYYANRTPDNLAAAIKESSEVYEAGKASWSWRQILAVAVTAIVALLTGVGSIAMVSRDEPAPVVSPVNPKVDPVPSPDIGEKIDKGFQGMASALGEMSLYLKGLGDKIDAKPKPLPVPVPPTPPIVQGIALPSTVNLGGGHVSIKATSAGAVTWFIPAYDSLTIDTFGDVAIVSAKPGAVNGVYWIGATTVSGGKVAPPVYCAITVNQGPQPPPPGPTPPDPKPDPNPTPSPKADSLSVVLIYESSDTNSKTAKVVADYVFWESLKPLGVKWYKIDKDQVDAKGSLLVDTHNYRQYMTAKGLPCILYMDKTGMVLQSESLPDNTATVRATITKLMGK